MVAVRGKFRVLLTPTITQNLNLSLNSERYIERCLKNHVMPYAHFIELLVHIHA